VLQASVEQFSLSQNVRLFSGDCAGLVFRGKFQVAELIRPAGPGAKEKVFFSWR
jgi:hypothetical protein